VRLLAKANKVTLESLIALGYDPTLTAFERLLPPLIAAFDALHHTDTAKAKLAAPIAKLREWNFHSSVTSVPTTLACLWGQDLQPRVTPAAQRKGVTMYSYIMNDLSPRELLDALLRVVTKLERDFGSWQTPWGEVNRFQRLSGEINAGFDDGKPSLPVGFASGNWGSLASFGASTPTKTKRLYGSRGNSFVAAVEFGPKVRAKSILAGGVSGDPASPHFMDQAEMYARGVFKDVRFHREDVERHAKRTYRPGEVNR
jgi:acyl-homoserine-lactone acylase